ncbi:head-tail adaptor protein [Nibribacter koreensis]|uniref:Phage head-tail joining protein n=1 Tax=Nibribacter koreensis TaxID=1084519 RepID=A0ABP8FB17_9BACT
MRTGDHRHRITLWQDVPEKQPNGDLTGERVHILDMWAKVTPMTGTRALNAAQILNGRPYEIEVRNPSPVQVTEDMLVQWDDTFITVKSAVDLDARGEVVLITGTATK